MSKGVLTFKEMLLLLKEVFVTNKEFIMLSHKYHKMSTYNRCYLGAYNIISWVINERINVTIPSDEAKSSTVGCSGKLNQNLSTHIHSKSFKTLPNLLPSK